MDKQIDRLIEILNETFAEQYEKRGLLTAPHTADHLLANGVLAPSFMVGQPTYSIVDGIIQPLEGTVYEITYGEVGFAYCSTRKGYFTLDFTDQDIGKTVFFTREEAHEAIAKRKVNK